MPMKMFITTNFTKVSSRSRRGLPFLCLNNSSDWGADSEAKLIFLIAPISGVLTCKKSEYNMIWIRWMFPKIVASKAKSTKECIVDFRVRPKRNRKTRTLKRFENNLHTFPQSSVQTKEVALYQASWLSPGPMVLDTWTKIRNPIHHIEYCKERGKRHPWVTLQRVGVEVKIVHFGLLNNGLSSQHGPCFVVV